MQIANHATNLPTPIHDVLVLTLASQFPFPVRYVQIIVHKGVTHFRIPQDNVEETLEKKIASFRNQFKNQT